MVSISKLHNRSVHVTSHVLVCVAPRFAHGKPRGGRGHGFLTISRFGPQFRGIPSSHFHVGLARAVLPRAALPVRPSIRARLNPCINVRDWVGSGAGGGGEAA